MAEGEPPTREHNVPDSEPNLEQPWYGAQDASRFLGLHRSTIHLAVKRSVLVPDATTPGGHYRFREATLLAFAERLRHGAATSAASAVAPLRVLSALTHMAACGEHVDAICAEAVAGIRRTQHGCDMCAIMQLHEPEDACISGECLAQAGFPDGFIDEWIQVVREGRLELASRVAVRTRQPIVYEDTHTVQMHFGTTVLVRKANIRSLVIVPIIADSLSLGVLVCASSHAQRFIGADLEFLQAICDAIALSMGAARYTATTRQLIAAALDVRRASVPDDLAGAGTPSTRLASLDKIVRTCVRANSTWISGFPGQEDTALRCTLLLDLTCRAWGSSHLEVARTRENNAVWTAAAVSIMLRQGARGVVGVVWRGEHRPSAADHALLVTYAASCLVALGG